MEDYKYAGFWRRCFSAYIDAVCLLPVIFVYNFAVEISVKNNSVLYISMYFLFLYIYLVLMIVRFGATPGRMILKTKIVDRYGNNLTVSRAILRNSTYILHTCVLLILFYTSIQITNVQEYTVGEAIDYISTYRDENLYYYLASLLICIDASFLLFNKKKRALHDYLADSFVIKKVKITNIDKNTQG